MMNRFKYIGVNKKKIIDCLDKTACGRAIRNRVLLGEEGWKDGVCYVKTEIGDAIEYFKGVIGRELERKDLIDWDEIVNLRKYVKRNLKKGKGDS